MPKFKHCTQCEASLYYSERYTVSNVEVSDTKLMEYMQDHEPLCETCFNGVAVSLTIELEAKLEGCDCCD